MGANQAPKLLCYYILNVYKHFLIYSTDNHRILKIDA